MEHLGVTLLHFILENLFYSYKMVSRTTPPLWEHRLYMYMCHGQNMVWFPIEVDGHPTTDTDLDTHYKESYCGMDDHKPYSMF